MDYWKTILALWWLLLLISAASVLFNLADQPESPKSINAHRILGFQMQSVPESPLSPLNTPRIPQRTMRPGRGRAYPALLLL